MKYIVRTSSLALSKNPEGFTSSDRCGAEVKAFCNAHGVPYEDVFVSIAIRIDKPSPLRPVGIRSVYNLSHEFGPYSIELADHVISDIQVVAAGDFQTIICKAIQLQCSSSDAEEWKKFVAENVFDLRSLKGDQKTGLLEKAARKLPSGRYAEARVFRALRTGDKKI